MGRIEALEYTAKGKDRNARSKFEKAGRAGLAVAGAGAVTENPAAEHALGPTERKTQYGT